MLTKWITWWGLIANLIWGVVVLFSPAAMGSTPLSTVADFFGRSPVAVSTGLLSASMAAFVAMLVDHEDDPDARTLVLLVPQQFFMLLAAGGAVLAILTETYADGVQRPMAFILADQTPWVLGAVLYTLSIVEHFGKPFWKALWTRIWSY
jgi:hypothetical protein